MTLNPKKALFAGLFAVFFELMAWRAQTIQTTWIKVVIFSAGMYGFALVCYSYWTDRGE